MITTIKISAVMIAAGFATAIATAQQAPKEAGKVIETGGPVGAVVVLRGAQSYPAQKDDVLVQGDRVFTRSDGTVKLAAGGCERSLDSAASITIDKDICRNSPVSLASIDVVSGPASANASVARAAISPDLLGALASGGEASAAATADSAGVLD